MLGSAPGIAFLPSTDLSRARRFFEDLGLDVVTVNDYACVLRAGTTTLRVTRVDQLQPQPFTVFGWEVADIRAIIHDLAARGISCLRYDGMEQDAEGIWTTPAGDQIAWFPDPDSNVLSLTQYASISSPDVR